MIVPRETLYAALFTQWQTALGSAVKTSSRHWLPPDQVAPPDRPALFQVQTGEVSTTTQKIAGLPVKWDAKVDLVLYTTGSTDPGVVPSTELNALLDAVENALPNVSRGIAQTLGGKVYTARIDGKVEIVENVAGAMAMAVIPVILVQGS
jgi:hypothetical protein